MKKLLFFSALLTCISISARAQFDIKVKIKGLPKDSSCVLAHYYGQKQYIPKDTAKADEAGMMHFYGKEKLPGGIYLIVLPKGNYFELIISDQQKFSVETDTANFIKHMKIKGSEENTLFYQYQQFLMDKGMMADSIQKTMKGAPAKDSLASLDILRAIDKEVKEYREKFVSTNAGTFTVKVIKAAWDPEVPSDIKDRQQAFYYYRNHFFDYIDFSDERMVRTPLYQAKLERYMKELTVQTPDSVIKSADIVVEKASANKEMFKYTVWYITNAYETSNIMGMDAVFVHMARKYYLSGRAFWIDSSTKAKIKERADLTEPLLMGKKVPNIYCTDSLGRYIPLYSVKAKYTILYFWSPDCGHCQKVTPKLYEFFEANKSKGIMVYAVSIERTEANWKKYIREHKLFNWINVWDSKTNTDFHNIWDISSTPVLYILDENKVIIGKKIGVEQLEDYFNNFLLKPKN